MSDLFSIYEDSLNVILKSINQIINSMKNLSKEKTEYALNEAHSNLKEADRILKQMELEVESAGNKMHNILLSKFRNSKGEVESSRQKFMRLQESYINRKSLDALMILDSMDESTNHEAQKINLIESEENFEEIEKYKNNESKQGINDTALRNTKGITNVNEVNEMTISEHGFHKKPTPLTTRILRKINVNYVIFGVVLALLIGLSIGLCFLFL